ncbi:MmcQ/YjbR family DNA-binding protein [Polycladidibacter stylochi]|uniref:MmcQ/YjbR family DNA-binding protein n=1 Tax=Polycladidibacter stylochi TaxID=1807766 RepID=UPI000830317B|nr:MmcQ/YjbR family DNA-binding protein [Pseudovibrio stylochi]
MDLQEFDAFCSKLPATTHVVQWGGASVWKVGGKIFAICPQNEAVASENGAKGFAPISFKCSDLAFQILIEQEDVIPAPYLARAKWVKVTSPSALDDTALKDYLRQAHEIIGKKLTKKTQHELGLPWV